MTQHSPTQRILVTGGSGFIGTHLCRELINKGHRVEVLDIASPRVVVPGVIYHLGNVCDSPSLDPLVENSNSIFHLAAVASVAVCETQPLLSYQTNLVGTATVLESIRKVQQKAGRRTRIVYSGTAAVYGALGNSGEALHEELLPSPISLYGTQKLASEKLIQSAHTLDGIPGVIFRFFNVYGPGQDPASPYSGVITAFQTRLSEGVPIALNGGGGQTRDFISINDVVRACLFALELPEDQCKAQPMNLASGQRVTIRELAHLMMEVTGKKVEVESAPPRPGDIQHSLGDNGLARKILGWSPEVSLREGLRELCRGEGRTLYDDRNLTSEPGLFHG